MQNKVKWTNVHRHALNNFEITLMSDTILQIPYGAYDYILETDACYRGLEVVLIQPDDK